MEIGKSTLNNLIFAGMFVLLVSCSHSPTSNQGDVQTLKIQQPISSIIIGQMPAKKT